jgi:hypothetical protein
MTITTDIDILPAPATHINANKNAVGIDPNVPEATGINPSPKQDVSILFISTPKLNSQTL